MLSQLGSYYTCCRCIREIEMVSVQPSVTTTADTGDTLCHYWASDLALLAITENIFTTEYLWL